MKKILLAIAILFCCSSAIAKIVYCQVIPMVVYYDNIGKFRLRVDYGKGITAALDSTNHLMEFPSHTAILNYMANEGWELVAVYVTGDDVNYVMKKEEEN